MDIYIYTTLYDKNCYGTLKDTFSALVILYYGIQYYYIFYYYKYIIGAINFFDSTGFNFVLSFVFKNVPYCNLVNFGQSINIRTGIKVYDTYSCYLKLKGKYFYLLEVK